MAIFKEINSDYGVLSSYHKITKFVDDRINKFAYIECSSFKDEASKNMKPLAILNVVCGDNAELPYEFNPSDLTGDGMNHIKKAYDLIKTLPEFEGATDV